MHLQRTSWYLFYIEEILLHTLKDSTLLLLYTKFCLFTAITMCVISCVVSCGANKISVDPRMTLRPARNVVPIQVCHTIRCNDICRHRVFRRRKKKMSSQCSLIPFSLNFLVAVFSS